MPNLTITLGLPASGKTTWAREQNALVVSKDDIREAWARCGWVWSREAEKDVVAERDRLITAALDGGQDVISSDTNFRHIEELTALAHKCGATHEVKSFLDVPPWECARRNASRPNSIPEKVIWEMAEAHMFPEQILPNRNLPQLFLDLDGVFADFDGFIQKELGIVNDRDIEDPNFWDIVRGYRGRLYFDMEPTPYARDLYEALRPYNPVILTGAPFSIPHAAQDKRDWVAKYLDPTVPVITCKSRNKSKYALPRDILLDDWEKHRSKWEAVGGRWITHRGPQESIARVKELLG